MQTYLTSRNYLNLLNIQKNGVKHPYVLVL